MNLEGTKFTKDESFTTKLAMLMIETSFSIEAFQTVDGLRVVKSMDWTNSKKNKAVLHVSCSRVNKKLSEKDLEEIRDFFYQEHDDVSLTIGPLGVHMWGDPIAVL